jgi:hypothetical protein
MSRLRFFLPTFAAAVCVLGTMACADSATAPPRTPPGTQVPLPSLVTLNGVVHVASRGENGVVLQTTDGEIRLAGSETVQLERVEGAEVEVRGTWDAVDAFAVRDFLVRAVAGLAALDGVVTEMYADDLENDFIGYGLRLTGANPLIVPLIDPPGDLSEHLGDRVWVTSAPGGKPMSYGVIRRAAEPE